MYKRLFMSALIAIQRSVALIGLLTLTIGFQNVSAQQQIAQDAYAIFEASCLNCHGPDGAFRETLLMEYAEIIDGGSVVPGNPNASELYKRLLGPTENGAQMPFGLPQLPAQSIEMIRNWILAGAPDWAAPPTTDRPFISPAEIMGSIETHLMSLEPFNRAFARYFTLTHLYNAGETAEILREYQKALSKLVNSLSWGSAIINPQPIDPHATIFYIDLRHYEWDRNDAWTQIEDAYPYHISFDALADLALRNQLGRLQRHSTSDVPSVHADWFIATASTPPLYHDLLSLPLTDRELETRLEVDVAQNLTNAPGVRVWRAGFNNSGVSNHNRVVERHTSQHGAYWKSYDFAGSVGTQNIFTHPLAFTHDGGEVVFNLPNGLQGYFVSNASGFRLNEAPINIVSNPAASDPTVRNGISCFGCHTEGMKTFEDQARSVIESDPNPSYNKPHALRLYVEKSDMDNLVAEDMARYRVALEATGGVFGGVEPISRFHEAFQGPVDAAYAAAVLGLGTETFLQKVRENTGLQNAGLLALTTENGNVKRDTWTVSFRAIISALNYPGQVTEPPVVTQPDVIPGGLVDIPDPNLRAAVAEALGKNANDPITVEEMQALEGLDPDRVINDLTGLQFATNLVHLDLDRSQVSDISPLRDLTHLNFLEVHGPFSDISPIRGLINLEHLDVAGSNVSDLTPIAGLLNNLDVLSIPDNMALPKAVVQNGFVQIPDLNLRAVLEEALGTKAITPSAMEALTTLDASNRSIFNLAGLEFAVNLEELFIAENPLRDLSPLAGCINLVRLGTRGTPILDFSPLANLTKLEWLWLQVNSAAEDISPLAGLTNLRTLVLYGGDISEVSPLANMIELRNLTVKHNAVKDISLLAKLTNLEFFVLHNNEIRDISPLAGLTKLRILEISSNNISDISPIRNLTKLEDLSVSRNPVSDISELAGLENLRELHLENCKISDLSALAGLENLHRLLLANNQISDVRPLAELVKLESLNLQNNNITDFTPLFGLSGKITFIGTGNPGYPKGGPKIEGPWLWLHFPNRRLEGDFGTDHLSEVSGGTVTEIGIATHGATADNSVGDEVWTSHKLPITGQDNIKNMLGSTQLHGLIYGNVSLYSPVEQSTTLHIGAYQRVKVWVNGILIYQRDRLVRGEGDYTEFFPVTLRQGKNVLLIATDLERNEPSYGFFGFESDAEYTVINPGIAFTFSEKPIHLGDTFTLDIRAENIFDLAGWQFDIAFDPSILEALDLSEGDFLKTDGGTTFFQSGRIDNAAGKITGLSAALIADNGVSGSGAIVQVKFKAKSEGETELTLNNFLFGSITEEHIPAGPLEIRIAVKERLLTGDVNRDGVVNILDLIRVARQLGQSVPADSAVDVNGDGVVNIFDLTLVAQGIGGAAAPPAGSVNAATIETWIADARLADDGSIAFRQGIANLESLLATMIPQETALLPNYPNPFNPETWIPYQLAKPAEVALTIYDIDGSVVRALELGHQPVGIYQGKSRAAYWDGRNAQGERVASGIYFYTLSAGDFSATRKMLIRK